MKGIKMTTTRILDGQISLVDVEGYERPFVQLNEGKYAGVKYQYGEVTFSDTENGEASVNFQYHVYDHAGHDTISVAFKNYIGTVLSYIIAVTTASSVEDLIDWNDYTLE